MKMPTRTRTSLTLERSLHRKSLDANADLSKGQLAAEANKENFSEQYLQSPMRSSILTVSEFHEHRNVKSPKGLDKSRICQVLSPLNGNKMERSGTLPNYTPNEVSPFSEYFQNCPRRQLSVRRKKNIDRKLNKKNDSFNKSIYKITETVLSESINHDEDESIHTLDIQGRDELRRPQIEPRREMNEINLANGLPSFNSPKDTLKNLISVVHFSPGDCNKDIEQQHCSTPTLRPIYSVKRSLTFSPERDDYFTSAKRSLVDSSSISDQSECVNRSDPVKGLLDLEIYIQNNKLIVHVIQCRDLYRSNGKRGVNAYVKVALLLPTEYNPENGFQRTAVRRHSSQPFFDHKFEFDIKTNNRYVFDRKIQFTIWHRDRCLKRSEFLGCLSFPLQNIIHSPISGSFKLQSQSCLNNLSTRVSVIKSFVNDKTAVIMTSAEKRTLRQKSVEEDVISIESMTAANLNLIDANTNQPITLSKKAIHQRDADENLFLRFLELDPPTETGGGKMNLGRTPFTVTKKLTRTTDRGFGFSIVWTHPPRVEKIEPGLSADKNGILPGDYVIFVDKHNVVTMPEADVLNLIRSQGNTLTLETFRRSGSSSSSTAAAMHGTVGTTIPIGRQANGLGSKSRVTSAASNYTDTMLVGSNVRPSTACSSSSTMEAAKKRLHLPQVTFSKESIAPITDNRRRFLLQLISREQNFISALLFGMQRFVQPLIERKDLISPNDHRTLFQNIDELLRISEDVLEQLTNDDQEPQLNFTSRVYLSKTTAICAAYKKYCNGIKRADCVLVNKSRQAGSEFVAFITEPQVPRKRPDLTMFIHRPLQHFREILKLMQMLASNCHVDSEEHKNFTAVINELQAAYREITVSSGLMEPLGEGRPLLTLQDLESRMVFTKCKPFTLAVQGRQWIFGGDLSRVEGRSVKPYWTLLFSDIIVFAKVSRDRVLFITEEPIPIANIVDSCFYMRKKTAEFRITVDPNGRFAESPTGYCAPDLTRTPKKNARRKSLVLRAPSLELKAVWQNLLQRQIFLVNAALGSTPLSSPLDSPDVLNTLVPLCEIGMATTSIASMKQSSLDSITMKNQKSQQHRFTNPSEQFEMLIDEKCRILNKTGTPKASALHLANWMKGQLDKQQEEARLAAARSRENIRKEDEHLLYPEGDTDERITYWTRAQLEKRTKELNLAKEQGALRAQPSFGGKRLSGVEELSMDDRESEIKSQSRSTTSDSQITVRSSPVANVGDKISVCHHCHTNCNRQQRSSSTSPQNLVCNSLKVQHSQASPNRCCRLNGAGHSSVSSTSTNTATGGETLSQGSIKAEPLSLPQDDHTKSKSQEVDVTGVRILSDNESGLLLNGHCSSEEGRHSPESSVSPPRKHITPPPKPNRHSIKPRSSRNTKQLEFCNCDCSPADFQGTAISPDKVTQETCRLIEQETSPKILPQKISDHKISTDNKNPHHDCKCTCNHNDQDSKLDDELSLMLIGLAQLAPAAKLLQSDAAAFVPSIAVVPPTPDAILSKTTTNIWDNSTSSVITSTATKILINNVPRQAIVENIPEDSTEESPIDEELPYRPINNTSLRRYGTLSSLEKLPSEDRADDVHSSDGDDPPDELERDNELPQQDIEGDDDDIEVVTKEIFNSDNDSQKPWARRAGSFVAGKMSFFEESRAFIDKYLGRWNQENQGLSNNDEDLIDDCTSGATSGEEIWGTPTSGGDNDDGHGNSENTQSSPTKSSNSLNDDDDTELMMDELLMAPPMTASTIRGLLPRRRLEPLFEEETESDEENTQQESEEIKKGETTTNGHNSKDSTGSSSDETTEGEEEEGKEREMENEKEKKIENSTQPKMETGSINFGGHQPQVKSITKDQQIVPMPHSINVTNVKESETVPNHSSASNIIDTASTTRLIQMTISSLMTTMTMTTTMTAMNSSTSTTTSNESSSTLPKELSQGSNTNSRGTVVRKTKFSPPPPPPRRLLLTKTNLMNVQPGTSANLQQTVPQQSGSIADIGSSVDAVVDKIHKRFTHINQGAVFNTKNYAENTGPVANRQSTIIETSLLGPADKKPVSTSSTTVSTTTASTPKVEKLGTITNLSPRNSNSSSTSGSPSTAHHGSCLSPRLEMRLALNHDILGDEDLISYDPGPDLTTILGHDLSTFHRLTGRDLLTRTATNRVQPKEAVISFCQQRNSKMDTPTVNRRPRPVSVGNADCVGVVAGISSAGSLRNKGQHLQPNRNTWSSSAFAAASDVIEEINIRGNDARDASNRSTSTNSEETKLSDLEILAKREKMYCMSQSKSGSLARTGMNMKTMNKTVSLTRTRSTSSVAAAVGMTENDHKTALGIGRINKFGHDETGLIEGVKSNKILNFLTRRNSEVPLSNECSRTSLNESKGSTPEKSRQSRLHQQLSPRKDNDKPSLNRRLWKQITKRRRANSVSELVAS